MQWRWVDFYVHEFKFLDLRTTFFFLFFFSTVYGNLFGTILTAVIKFFYLWIGLSRKTEAFSIKEKGCQYSSQHKWNCETFQVCSFIHIPYFVNADSCPIFLIILYFVRMTLLLGPPGSGKTTLLKALAGGLGKDLRV